MFDKLARKEVSSSILPSTLKNFESWKDVDAFESDTGTMVPVDVFIQGRKRLVIVEFLQQLPRGEENQIID